MDGSIEVADAEGGQSKSEQQIVSFGARTEGNGLFNPNGESMWILY